MKSKLTVLVINEKNEHEKGPEHTLYVPLREQGYVILEALNSIKYLADKAKELQPDLVVLNLVSPNKADVESITLMRQYYSCPIVLFAEQGNTLMIKEAIHTGVSACVINGLESHRIKNIVDAAVAHFEESQILRLALEQSRAELADRKLIEKAKGLIMKHNHCAEEQAFKAMRKMAMDQQKPLNEVAKNIIAVLERHSNNMSNSHL